MFGSTTQTDGSRPQLLPMRRTDGVEPIALAKSKMSKKSPGNNASVTVKSTGDVVTNVHGGVSRNVELIPERHGTPVGSADWHPATSGAWFGSKPNSYQVFSAIGPADKRHRPSGGQDETKNAESVAQNRLHVPIFPEKLETKCCQAFQAQYPNGERLKPKTSFRWRPIRG
jgi:hypothetical protein